MNSKIKTAFSLIELSIVILIIGILVAGVTQSSRLVRAIKLQTARSITNSSSITAQNTIAKSLIVSYNSAYIGRFGGGYFNGDLGEIIIFSAALKAEELTSIKDYLAKKWGIKVT